MSAGSSVPPPAVPLPFALSYVLPVKAATPLVDDDFTQYLSGSPPSCPSEVCSCDIALRHQERCEA